MARKANHPTEGLIDIQLPARRIEKEAADGE